MWGKLQIIICQVSPVHVPASIRWLRTASDFSSLFWYVSDWWECADIVRFMNFSFCICEGWSLISAGRGAVGVSASVALIQFLKCVKLLIQYKPLQVHLVLTLVCVCVCAGWRWALLRTKERFMEGSLLWYKMEMIEWKWLPFSFSRHTMSPGVVTFNYVACCLSVLLYWWHWVIIDKNIVGAVPFCIVTHARDSVPSSWLGCSIWLIKLGYPCLTRNLDFYFYKRADTHAHTYKSM